MSVPIKAIAGVELDLLDGIGIATARVTNTAAKFNLSWDRFVRLKAAAEAIEATTTSRLLDAGGYDGALALFLPDRQFDVIDPATTGGSVLAIPVGDASYQAVVAVDVLEHIEPSQRSKALEEFARVGSEYIFLNYPCRESKEAQELALKLTKNPLVREHVEWELPDSDWVLAELAKYGFRGEVQPHTSIAVWLGQFVTLNLVPDAAEDLNRYLINNFANEPYSRPLYHLLVCRRDIA
ncbi:MAG TPA: class I SAM-dependent methyltransferase [Drouetiella sp.]